MPSTEITTTDQETAVANATELALAPVLSPEASFTAESNHLATNAGALAKAFIARGDACPIGEDEDPEDMECRIIHFQWADRAKHFLVLYRNVQLQLQTATLLVADGGAEPALVAQLHQRSAETLASAREEWTAETNQLRRKLKEEPKFRKQQLVAWKQLHNPWPEYRKQLVVTGEQSEALAEEYGTLKKQVEVFAALRKLLQECATAAEEGMHSATRRAKEIVSYVMNNENDNDQTRPGKIAARLDDYLAEKNPVQQMHQFSHQLSDLIGQLAERTRVTVGAERGMLQVKEVNFRRVTEQWISGEVLPQLYELWELSDQVTGELEVAIANVRNRTLLLANDYEAGRETNYDLEQLGQPFNNFLTHAKVTLEAFTKINERMLRLVERDLRLSAVYRPVPGFLPLQTGINEFTRRHGAFFAEVSNWFNKTFAGVQRWRGAATREDKMSVSEKLVRVISQRQPSADNSAYTNILMTRGYIGESFLVGRETEKERMSSLIRNWEKGYRGAVMLTGRRLSGKTLFGELVANRLFPNTVIRLRPNSTVNVDGRRMTTTGNLIEALRFIQKNTIRQRPMVWIDDLETWWDKTISLAENVRELSAHIDEYSARIFYLVSTTNAVNRHLNRFMDLERIFQAEVNLDGFPLEDMQQAILIRHGATHKQLVNAEGEPLSEAAFSRRIRLMHRATYGNVGDTLNRWAWFTEYCDEDRVTPCLERAYKLPAFLSADTGILLTTIFLDRRTNEYHLRRMLGPAFEQRYRNIVRRLHRVGLLNRHNDGWLEICESVVNDVGRALENNGYLNPGD